MSYPTPWQGKPPMQGPFGPPPMLASHADRERAVDVLRAGYGEGRLDHAEFEKRIARAYQARSIADLALLVADLPQGPQMQQPVAMAGPVPQTFVPAPQPRQNGKAVGSMVCGILTVFTGGITGIPAVVLGHMARAEIRRTGEAGDGFALTGLILGWLSVAGLALLMVLIMVFAAAAGSGG